MNQNFLLKTIFAALFLIFAVSANAGVKGASDMVLSGGKTGDVPFPHQKHQQVLNDDCAVCHNMFAQEKQIINQMKKDGRLEKKKVMNHCQGCHKNLAAQSKPAGPVKCKECHSR